MKNLEALTVVLHRLPRNAMRGIVGALLLAGAVVMAISPAQAAAGDIDSTFAPSNGATSSAGSVTEVVVQPDGKVLIGGYFTIISGAVRGHIARLNADGTLDTSFLTNGGANAIVNVIALQPDGKVLIGGGFSRVNGALRNGIARLNSDGTLDSSFLASGTGADFPLTAIVVQSDGKILVGGLFTNINGVSRNRIARLNSDGTLDTSFLANGSGADATVFSMALQSDGKVLIGGVFSSVNSVVRGFLARLNADGTFDSSFIPPSSSGPNSTVETIAIQADGKVLIGGSFSSVSGVVRSRIARMNGDGTLDATFVPSDINATVFAIAVQSDAKVLIAGSFTTVNGVSRLFIARLNTDGALDTSIFTSGTGTNSRVSAMVLQSDGKILIGGSFSNVNGDGREDIARLDTAGNLDTGFNTEAGTRTGGINVAVAQPDGRVLLGGSFTTVNGVTSNSIARLNADGTLDTSFLVAGTGANNPVMAMALQPDGRVLIGGLFTNINGVVRNRIARLNADGTLDSSFLANDAGTTGEVDAIVLQSDGRVLIGGGFATVNGVARNDIARLNTDGTLDTSFLASGAGANLGVNTMALQSDAKVVIGGFFTQVNGVTRNRIARLNSDGTLDSSFLTSGIGASGVVSAVMVQADGKVLIGGLFFNVNGVSRNRIARLNSDGTLDTPFPAGAGANGPVATMALQPDGKVLIGGSFAQVNGALRGGLARLKTDGAVDETFLNFSSGANASVNAIGIQSDGRVLIGGDFSTINSSTRFGIARLVTTITPNPIDVDGNFVTQHYRDFLFREPDPSGFGFWNNQMTNCSSPPPADLIVCRVNVSAAFYLSIEFQETGYLVERIYKTAFGDAMGTSTFLSSHTLPVPIVRLNEFLLDTQKIGQGVIVGQGNWQQQLETNKQSLTAEFVTRSRFTLAFPSSMTATQYVDMLNTNAGNPLSQSERDQLISDLSSNVKTRAQVLRTIAERPTLVVAEFNRAFVLMQFFGYLHRNPNDPQDSDYTGYDFWLTKLNQFGGNFQNAEMVKAFITSVEYRARFGQP